MSRFLKISAAFIMALTLSAAPAHAGGLRLLPAGAGWETLRREITRQITANSPWAGMDVDVSEIDAPGFEPSRDEFDEVAVGIPAGSRGVGRVSVTVTLSKSGVQVKKLWVSARVRVYRAVFAAAVPLRVNSVISREHIKPVKAEIDEAPDAALSFADALGMTVLRPMPAGAVVKKSYLRPRTIVKRGDIVTVVVESQRIRIKSKGIAMQDGWAGAAITIRTASGRELKGRLNASGELAVESNS
ncbi:MAG: flagellar basal body P-ring formation protein FlgA [Deltaproteobacteria bacterium]|nr:flagellar basal body P-ring formation protein FlgA [Deltaproteobacteria bacterium]